MRRMQRNLCKKRFVASGFIVPKYNQAKKDTLLHLF